MVVCRELSNFFAAKFDKNDESCPTSLFLLNRCRRSVSILKYATATGRREELAFKKGDSLDQSSQFY